MNGGVEEWNFAFKKYKETTVSSEHVKLLYGMSAIQEPSMLQGNAWFQHILLTRLSQVKGVPIKCPMCK